MADESNTRGVKAIRALERADRWANKKPIDPFDGGWNRLEAERARAEAEELIKPPDRLVRGGGEVVPDVEPDEVLEPARNAVLSTLENPNMISVEASERRTEAAFGAGVLQSALDAAVSANAENSLERMLCHQMAGAHFTAMKLLAVALNPRLPPVELARLTNASARMMQVYQEALLALQRFRTGGKQTVVVQVRSGEEWRASRGHRKHEDGRPGG